MLILIILVILLLLYNNNKESFAIGDIYLKDPYQYQEINYMQNNRYDPLQYNNLLDDLDKYSKYRKNYKYPKNAKYNINATVIYKPRNCVVTKWSNWSTCSKKCDGGIKTRHRMILKPSKNGGATCPILKENISCNTQSCIPFNYLKYKTVYYIKNNWGIGSYMASCGYTNSCSPYKNLSVSTYKSTNNSYLKKSPNWSRWKLEKVRTNNPLNNNMIYYNDIVKIQLEANNYILVTCSYNSCNDFSSLSVSASDPNGTYVKLPNGNQNLWKIVSATGKSGIVKLGDKIKLINLWNNTYLNACGNTTDCGSGKLYAINTTKQNQRDASLDVSNWSFETSFSN